METRHQDLWRGTERLIDRAPSLADLKAHRLHLLAARLWRKRGIALPEQLVREERTAACQVLMASAALERVRESCDDRLILFKGPEAAHHYPPACRPYGDLDVLAEDPERTQRALIAAGFEPMGFDDSYYEGLHHLRPLRPPGLPGPLVEVHRHPNWLGWAEPPSAEVLFAAAVPSLPHPDGYLALPAAHHSLVLAAHSWSELPLRRILDLVDVLAVAPSGDGRAEVLELAEEWQMTRVWEATLAAAEGLLLGAPASSAVLTWARNLAEVRDRTVLENHLRRWVSAFWAMPAGAATGASLLAVARDLTPVPAESWANKLRRAWEAVRNPLRSATAHSQALGGEAHRARFKRR